MLKIKEPIHLNCLKMTCKLDNDFCDTIRDNYELFVLHSSPMALLYLFRGEQKPQENLITTIHSHEVLHENVSFDLRLLERFIHKIILIHNHRDTYKDDTFVEAFLVKSGIHNTRKFLSRLLLFLKESEHIVKLTQLYQSNADVINDFFQFMSSDNMQVSHQFTKNLIKKLGIKQNVYIVNSHMGAASVSQDITYDFMNYQTQQMLLLTDYLEQQPKTNSTPAQTLHVHVNPYEIMQVAQAAEEKILEALISAVLINVVDSVYILSVQKMKNMLAVLRSSDFNEALTDTAIRFLYAQTGAQKHYYSADFLRQINTANDLRYQYLGNLISQLNKKNEKNNLPKDALLPEMKDNTVVFLKNRQLSHVRHVQKDDEISVDEAMPKDSRKILETVAQFLKNPEHMLQSGKVLLHPEGLLYQEIQSVEQKQAPVNFQTTDRQYETVELYEIKEDSTAHDRHIPDEKQRQAVINMEEAVSDEVLLIYQALKQNDENINHLTANYYKKADHFALKSNIAGALPHTKLLHDFLFKLLSDVKQQMDIEQQVNLKNISQTVFQQQFEKNPLKLTYGGMEADTKATADRQLPVQESRYKKDSKQVLNTNANIQSDYTSTNILEQYTDSGQNQLKSEIINTVAHMNSAYMQREVEKSIGKQLSNISEMVYSKLEKKLSDERKRRGY